MNNNGTISGKIATEPVLNHRFRGENFYYFDVESTRLSGTKDVVPVTVSEHLLKEMDLGIGKRVKITGQFRSYNLREGDKSKLILRLFANEICADDRTEGDVNYITLTGWICKPVILRETPLKREISDILLAVHRPCGKSDYIPCICWGRNARFADGIEVGTHIKITGCIQSREYRKRISEDEYETKTAYEVSISKLEVIEGEECKDQVADAE